MINGAVMFINLAMTMRDQGITDADLAKQLEMSELDFIDKKCGVGQFSQCERLAVSLLLGLPTSWLFEKV